MPFWVWKTRAITMTVTYLATTAGLVWTWQHGEGFDLVLVLGTFTWIFCGGFATAVTIQDYRRAERRRVTTAR